MDGVKMTKYAQLMALGAVAALAACDKPAPTAAAPAAATAKTVAGDWLNQVVATPEGGIRVGNPDAKVKLLEFASLTCPHCREFQEQGMPTVRSKYIASGNMSYEFRPFILNGIDFAPSLLVRCQSSPAAGLALLDAFYATQQSWTVPFTKLTPEDTKRLQALPPAEQIKGLALAGGLDGFMRTRGQPRAKFDQCLTDKAGIDQLSKIRDEAVSKYELTGTPTFVLNGVTQKDVFNWEKLQPKLETALQ